MIKCPYCQKETFDDSVFCGWCGKKMETVTAVVPQEPRSAAVFEEPSPVVPVTSPSAPAKPVSGGKSLKAFAPLAEVLKDPLKRDGDWPFLRPPERVPEGPVVSRGHLPQLEKIQGVLMLVRRVLHEKASVTQVTTF